MAAVAVGTVAVVVVLVLLVLSGSVNPGSAGGAEGVRISEVEWDLSGLPCSGDPGLSLAPGTTVAPGTVLAENASLVNGATLGTCTFQDPVATPGFAVVFTNAPLTIDAGGNATLEVRLATPTINWTGTLVVTVGVSTTP